MEDSRSPTSAKGNYTKKTFVLKLLKYFLFATSILDYLNMTYEICGPTF
jgi:hypothetical protein